MILNYTARNAMNPKATAAHIDQFTKMAHQQDPALMNHMPMYHKVAKQISDRIEGLDQMRRQAAHQDLNDNLLGHVATALQTGQTAPAIHGIRQHLTKLAGMYGVPTSAAPVVPQMEIGRAHV